MEKKEYVEQLNNELLKRGFQRNGKRYWWYKKRDFMYKVEIQNSQYAKTDYYINLYLSIDGYSIGEENYKDSRNFFIRAIPDKNKRFIEINPSLEATLEQIDELINDLDTLEKFKQKFLSDEIIRRGAACDKLIQYCDPNDKRLEPRKIYDYTKKEELIRQYATYNIHNDTVYISREYYSMDEQMWKDFVKELGLKMSIVGLGKYAKPAKDRDFTKDENFFVHYVSYIQGKGTIYVNKEYYILDEKRWEKYAEDNHCTIKVYKW